MFLCRQLSLLANQETTNFKTSLDVSPYSLHDDARVRLQQLATSAVTSGYLPFTGGTSPPCSQPFKQPFSIDSIIGTENKSNCVSHQQALPVSPLPAFASQFGATHGLNIPHNLMMSYRTLRPTESELISNLASTYGQMNGNVLPLEYYSSLKALPQTFPSLPLPLKPTALSAISLFNGQETTPLKIPRSHISDVDKMTSEKMTSNKATTKPSLGHSVDVLLRPTKDNISQNRNGFTTEKILNNTVDSVKGAR